MQTISSVFIRYEQKNIGWVLEITKGHRQKKGPKMDDDETEGTEGKEETEEKGTNDKQLLQSLAQLDEINALVKIPSMETFASGKFEMLVIGKAVPMTLEQLLSIIQKESIFAA
jgi:hypothetical protein